VASAAKTWAVNKGITHYTHWFQPLTGAMAEKHDSFFDASTGIEKLKGSALVQQEPDASSFPNGGIRSTFEARGYTAWDPSSPIFILGRTLCIPTVFVAYTGEALDYKAPLLKSMEAINKAAVKVCQLFDRNEIEALKLGIPVSTRHNEVAPSQFEVAPLFEEINVATDHNQLLMEVMNRVAVKHKLKVLFHEKPFAGLNGSGKHNNWSLITNTGVNLFQPSSSARENLQFLTFFVCTIKAIYKNAALLRASIASAGNDHRLGANEAPPAIMSVFIGEQLTGILDEIEISGG